MSIHSRNDAVILEFGLRKPAFRICVNTPTTHGSIGLTTGLDPAMTLGCGGFGGNITSDNITPRHLLNIKRLAYALRPRPRGRSAGAGAGGLDRPAGRAPPQLPQRPSRAGAAADSGRRTVGRHRSLAGEPRRRGAERRPRPRRRPPRPRAGSRSSAKTTSGAPPATGRQLLVGPRTILTPAARDAGAARDVLVWLDGAPR